MAEHRFKIGQTVYLRLKKARARIDAASESSHLITMRLPATDGEFEYVIRSAYDGHERVVRESELTGA